MALHDDRDNGMFRAIWDRVPWGTTNIIYLVGIWDYSGGPPRAYLIYHPTNFIYSYAKWGAKVHIEVYAADKITNRLSRVVSKDVQMQDRPASAIYTWDYPSHDSKGGLNQWGGYYPEGKLISYTISWPVTEDWIHAQTTLSGSVPFDYVPVWYTLAQDGPSFQCDLPVGAVIHQETVTLYPGNVTVTTIKDFTVQSQF